MTKLWTWELAPDGVMLDGVGRILRDGRGRNRANVWSNGTWHTWDESGIGGENASCEGRYKIADAMDQVMAAVVRQGWVSWHVEYPTAKTKTTQKKGL